MSGCLVLSVPAAETPAAAPATNAAAPPEVRFITVAPSSYTLRYDSVRAGLGIALQLKRLSTEHKLPVRITYHNAVPALTNAADASALLKGAPVIVLGGSTWSQGSSAPMRRLFEIVGSESLWGVCASVWVTSGGSHTGGEMVALDTLRSLMGMGAQVFTLGQKLMVFTTDERLNTDPGEFTLLDCWYMEQFAKALLVQAHGRGDMEKSHALAEKISLVHTYYLGHPKTEEELLPRQKEIRDLVNSAADLKSGALVKITRRLELGTGALRPALPGLTQ
jgi:hypothetical protein